MIEDELIKIWKSSSNQERIKFEKSKLMIELESSLKRLYRWWKYMEITEVVLAIFGILVAVFTLFLVPFILLKIAIALIMICAIYLIMKYQSTRKFKPSAFEENYLNYLKSTRAYLEVQKRFLKTYVNWSILPVFPILLLFDMAMWKEVPKAHYLIIFINVAAIVMGIYGYVLNKKRVKNKINPRIESIDELINMLKE